MKKIKLTQDYCTSKSHGAQPVSEFEKRIPANDSVRLLSQVVEEIDLSPLYHTFSKMGRKPAVPPDIMLYAYMENNYASRLIEKSCRRDINYMWLLRGQTPPDHNTVARFRTMRLRDCLEDLFFQLIVELFKADEIELSNLFIDGTTRSRATVPDTISTSKTQDKPQDRRKVSWAWGTFPHAQEEESHPQTHPGRDGCRWLSAPNSKDLTQTGTKTEF